MYIFYLSNFVNFFETITRFPKFLRNKNQSYNFKFCVCKGYFENYLLPIKNKSEKY